ncbi:MAG: ABC transporter substrate-binding protein [Patescibacteria group bacterium]
MNKKIVVLFLLFVFIITSGFGCKTVSTETQKAMEPITLEYWRVFDDSDAFQEIITKYNEIHPNITIKYRKLRVEEYEKELVEAMAEDRGPDMFAVHNTWVKKYENKISPMPAEITMAYQTKVSGSDTPTISMKTTKSLTINDVQRLFPDVVAKDAIFDILVKDVVVKNQIFGLPLSVDTLALFYNKDLFNGAGIATPPQFWDQVFQDDVKKLSKQNPKREIIKSGVALGASSNIQRFSDILMLLMMQNGSKIMEGNQVIFHTIPESLSASGYNPGLGALIFFTDFSNPTKYVYSWNDTMPNSLEMFISGNLAMTFAYSYDLPTIKSRAPKMNFAVAKIPQIADNPEVNFANYWLETVSKKSKYPNESWDFIQFATKEEQAKLYLAKTKKPTALRSLIGEQINDLELSPFAQQILTAKSWYQGKNPQAAETAIGEMINNATKNYEQIQEVLNFGANQVQQTIQ